MFGRTRVAAGVAAAAALAVACGPVGPSSPAPRAAAAVAPPPVADRDVSIVLYRDGAVVRERRWVEVGPRGKTVLVPIPADTEPDDVLVLTGAGAEPPDLEHGPAGAGAAGPVRARIGGVALTGAERAASGLWVLDAGKPIHLYEPPVLAFAGTGIGPAVDAHVVAARRGRYPVDVVYVTSEMSWRASYTLIGAGAGRGVLHGALIVDDQAGLPVAGAALTVVDEALGGRADAAAAVARVAADRDAGTPLGRRVDVAAGQTAIDLVGGGRTVGIRSVLVYDPVGARLDQPTPIPVQARDYGLGGPEAPVAESAEVDLGAGAGALPAGTVRLVERERAGTLRLRGEGILRGGRGATTTIAIGRSPDVVGRRDRIEWSLDLHARRLVEEFELTLENHGGHPARVLVREHLYRGLSWTLPYVSVPRASKEGPQQIALRTDVPAHGLAKVVYVVVYTW